METTPRRPRFFLASLAAALATVLVPTMTSLYGLLFWKNVDLLGRPDDAPHRAAYAILFLMPIIFLIVLLLWYVVTRLLDLFRILSKSSLLVGCILFCLLFASSLAMESYKDFGLKDAIISFSTDLGVSLVCLGLGSLIWWVVAFVGLRQSAQPAPIDELSIPEATNQ